MIISDEQLVEMLPVKRMGKILEPSELRAFFKVEKGIRIKDLAVLCNCTASAITSFFNGYGCLSQAKQQILLDLRNRIITYEGRSGKKWGDK